MYTRRLASKDRSVALVAGRGIATGVRSGPAPFGGGSGPADRLAALAIVVLGVLVNKLLGLRLLSYLLFAGGTAWPLSGWLLSRPFAKRRPEPEPAVEGTEEEQAALEALGRDAETDTAKRIVALLEENDGVMRQKELVGHLDVSKATVSRNVADLCDRGVVEKRRLGRENLVALDGCLPTYPVEVDRDRATE